MKKAFLVLLLLCAGCSRGEPKGGMWHACNCPYLTDYDEVAKHSMDVCVASGTKPEDMAATCASRMTHGPSEACTCAAATGACDGKDLCRSKEYK